MKAILGNPPKEGLPLTIRGGSLRRGVCREGIVKGRLAGGMDGWPSPPEGGSN